MTAELDTEIAALLDARIGQVADAAADHASILLWCAAAEDPNPRHWAKPESPCLVAPPAMAGVWTQPLPWTPGGTGRRALELHHRLKAALDVPAAVVREISSWYGEPVRVGDRIASTHRITHIGPERRGALGVGFDWALEVIHRNQRGELIAVDTWGFHGYRPRKHGSRRAGPPTVGRSDAAAIPGGRPLAGLEVGITTSRIITAAAASRDWTAFHHDPVAAAAVGLRDIILNTPGHAALVTRWLTGTVAPGGRLMRLSLRLRSPVHPGDRLRVSGVLTREASGPHGPLRDVELVELVAADPVGAGRATIVGDSETADPWAIPLPRWAELDDPGVPLIENH